MNYADYLKVPQNILEKKSLDLHAKLVIHTYTNMCNLAISSITF